MAVVVSCNDNKDSSNNNHLKGIIITLSHNENDSKKEVDNDDVNYD